MPIDWSLMYLGFRGTASLALGWRVETEIVAFQSVGTKQRGCHADGKYNQIVTHNVYVRRWPQERLEYRKISRFDLFIENSQDHARSRTFRADWRQSLSDLQWPAESFQFDWRIFRRLSVGSRSLCKRSKEFSQSWGILNWPSMNLRFSI